MEYKCESCGHEHLITYFEYKNGTKCPICKGKTEPKDPRGVLFFEIARIAEAKQPKMLLLENVKGLVSSAKGEVLRIFIETLNIIGYTIDFEVLNSKYFGVPQNRERIYIVGVLDGVTEEWDVGKRKDVVAKGKRRIAKIDGVKTFNFDWPKPLGVVKTLADVLESEVDEKYYLSEEKTAKLVEQLPQENTEVQKVVAYDRKNGVGKKLEVAFTLNSSDWRGMNRNQKQNALIEVVGMLDMKGNDAVRRVYAPTGISPTLTTMGGGNREPKIVEVRPVLTPDRVNKRQNGRRFKEDGEESFTLTAIDRHGIAIGKFPKYRIRKLTPLECLRLQGFPDEYYHKLKEAGISDTQLYKMAGNAVTVNVITAIVKQLKKLAEVVECSKK